MYYRYRCKNPECLDEFEVAQKLSDAPLSECDKCGDKLFRVIQKVGISFSGSGWHSTDYNSYGRASKTFKDYKEAGGV